MVLICCFFSVCCAVLAHRRNRGVVAWTVLGLVFGPFALILLACMGPLPESGVSSRKREYSPATYDRETRRLMDSPQVRAWKTTQAEAQAKMDAEALEAEVNAKMNESPDDGGSARRS